MSSSIYTYDEVTGKLKFNDDGHSFYNHEIVECIQSSYHKREENVEMIHPVGLCPENSLKHEFSLEAQRGERYHPECRSINRIRRTQEQGLFGDNMTIEEKDYVSECPGLLAIVVDGDSVTVHCRVKVI